MRGDTAAARPDLAAAIAAGLLLTLVSSTASALEASLSVGYEGEYTDNPRRSEAGSSSDIIHRPLVEVAAFHSGASTQLSLDYSAYRRIYQDDTFDDETVMEGAARIDWIALPERLTLFAANTRRERSIRTDFVRTPDNLQVQSDTLAGATLQADLLSNHFGTLTYTYEDIHTESTRSDSGRHSLQAAYVIPWSPTDTFQVIAAGSDTDFDDPNAPDYQSVTGSVAYDRLGAVTTLAARVGYTSIDRELGRDSVEGVVGGVDITRQLGAGSSVSVGYDRSFNDNSLRSAALDFGFDDEVIVGDTDANEVFDQQTARLAYETLLGVNRLTLALTGVRQEYESDIGRDSDRLGTSLTLSRPVRPNLIAYVGADYTRYDYTEGGGDDHDRYAARVGFDWEATRRLFIGTEARYYERRERDEAIPGDDMDGLQGDVDDWGVIVRLTYLLFGSPVTGVR